MTELQPRVPFASNAVQAVPRPGAVESTHDEHFAFRLLLAGALMVLVTCASYALAGPLACLPAGAPSAEAARAATPAAAGWMLLASWAGMPGDVLMAVAGFMLAQRRGQAAQTGAGWYGLAIISLVFLLVDTMVGQVLPVLAAGPAGPNGDAAYAAARALFDALFHMGTFVGGLSALALAWGPARPRIWGWVVAAAGMAGVIAGGAGLLGWGQPHFTGLAVTLLVVGMAGWGFSGIRGSDTGR